MGLLEPDARHGATHWAHELERLRVSRNRLTALCYCFCAIPDGKPLRTFPGIALGVVNLSFEDDEFVSLVRPSRFAAVPYAGDGGADDVRAVG